MCPDESPPSVEFNVRRGAVAVIFEQGRLLVIRRAAGVAAPGKICFPGGAIEPGESEEQAVERELAEELRLQVRPVRRLWECVTPWKVHLAWWLTERIDDAEPDPHPAEVAEVFWFAPDQLAGHTDLLTSNGEFLAAVKRGEIRLD